MTREEARTIALDAAGIMDAFRLAQVEDHDGCNRYEEISDDFGGFIGIADEIVSAAEAMDDFRRVVRADAKWGEELSHQYEAWDAAARGLRSVTGKRNTGEIVVRGLLRLIVDGGHG